jgi:hypothetical protein
MSKIELKACKKNNGCCRKERMTWNGWIGRDIALMPAYGLL